MSRLMPTWLLILLVRRDYRLRSKGLRPDRWYWADLELIRRGVFVQIDLEDQPQ